MTPNTMLTAINNTTPPLRKSPIARSTATLPMLAGAPSLRILCCEPWSDKINLI